MPDRYRRHPEVRLTRLDEEGVALHLGERRYFTLNDAGASLLDALALPRTVEEMTHLLVAEFDVTSDVAAKSVVAFVADCASKGLVEVVGAD
jgi:hypothetical protein